jgi:hypothetical protein
LNKWALGLSNSPTDLFARFLATPQYILTSGGSKLSGTAVIISITTPGPGLLDYGQMYISVFSGTKPHGPGSGFPYGFLVEPDR